MTFGPEDFQIATDVSHETLERLKAYARLLQQWQDRINLVGPATVADMWQRHFMDSAQIAGLVADVRPELDSATWLDLGSGAGFPGLVLSIMGFTNIHLVESNRKKCTFLRQVIRETGASAKVYDMRIEDLPQINTDVVTSRALSSLSMLLELAAPFISRDTELWFLKGQDVDKELQQATISWKMDVQSFPSCTEEAGRILRLRGIKRVEEN